MSPWVTIINARDASASENLPLLCVNLWPPTKWRNSLTKRKARGWTCCILKLATYVNGRWVWACTFCDINSLDPEKQKKLLTIWDMFWIVFCTWLFSLWIFEALLFTSKGSIRSGSEWNGRKYKTDGKFMGQRWIHVYEPLPKYVFHFVCPLSSFRTEGILSYPLNPVEFGYPTETLHVRNFFLFGLVKIQKKCT